MANEALVKSFSAALERAYSHKTRPSANQADFERQNRPLSTADYDKAVQIVNAARDVRTLDALLKAYLDLFFKYAANANIVRYSRSDQTFYELFERCKKVSTDKHNLFKEWIAQLESSGGSRLKQRFQELHPTYQSKIRALVPKPAPKKQRFLIDSVAEDYRRRAGVAHQSTAELMKYLAAEGEPEQRTAFETVATRCETAWIAPSSNKKSRPSAAVAALEAAFNAYDHYLRDAIRQPADAFRILTWLREADDTLERVVLKGKQAHLHSKRKSPWGTVWVELYLDTLARAQTLAASKWNIDSVIQARAFVGPDARFMFEPFNARDGQLMRVRLKMAFGGEVGTGVPEFAAFHRARRRSRMIGKFWSLDILNELESLELLQEIASGWQEDARDVAGRKVTTSSREEAFRSTFHINDTAKNVFTMLWIPTGRQPPFVIIETLKLPGFFFRAYFNQFGRVVGLAELLKDNFYAELAKNAQNLTVFLLAYLQVLGYALDIATAGASGGLRFIILRFAEERLKEQALDLGFKIAGIDNPWAQTLLGMGANLVPSAISRPKGLNAPADPDLTPSSGRATAIKTTEHAEALSSQSKGVSLSARTGEGAVDAATARARAVDNPIGARQPGVVAEPPTSPKPQLEPSPPPPSAPARPAPSSTDSLILRRMGAEAQLRTARPANEDMGPDITLPRAVVRNEEAAVRLGTGTHGPTIATPDVPVGGTLTHVPSATRPPSRPDTRFAKGHESLQGKLSSTASGGPARGVTTASRATPPGPGSASVSLRTWAVLEQAAENAPRFRPTDGFGKRSARSGNREVIIVEGEVRPPVADAKFVNKVRRSGPRGPGEHATHSVGAQLGENLPEGLTSGPASDLNLSLLKTLENATRDTYEAAVRYGVRVETKTTSRVEYRIVNGQEVGFLTNVRREAWLVVGQKPTTTFLEFEASIDAVTRVVTVVRNKLLRPSLATP